MMKQLFEYAVRERDRGVYDFTEIISGFYRKLDLEYNDIPTRNSFTNRLLRIMKEYVETDPRYQGKIDNYLNKIGLTQLVLSGLASWFDIVLQCSLVCCWGG